MIKDSLEFMMNKQLEFQKRLGNDITSQAFVTEQATAMFVETGEMLQETNWKSWKKPSPINNKKFKEEIIDMWHFMLNISLAAGMDAQEILERFTDKHITNNERQDGGY
jgi:dimeric dUTPase (all-alpha-NTP-PPase superfamily)